MRLGLWGILPLLFVCLPTTAGANEEELYYKLEKVWQNLKQYRCILVECITNLKHPELNLDLVAIRFEQVQSALARNRRNVVQLHNAWNKIRDDLIAKYPKTIEDYSDKICKPLAQIQDQNAGDMIQIEEAMQDLLRRLSQNQKPAPAALSMALAKYDRLLDRIETVLLTNPNECFRMTQTLVAIEMKQRKMAKRLWDHFCQQQFSPFWGIPKDPK